MTPTEDESAEPAAAPIHDFAPLHFRRISPDESVARARAFYEAMNRRRTTRHFSPEPVPRELIELALRAAAEDEEHRNYHGRMPPEWIEALVPLGTDEHKPHLTDAPWVVVLFRHTHGLLPDGRKRTLYYTQESCGIAAGFFIAAIHQMGLVTLTHTPNPMGFLGELLERPANEKAFLVMPVGYPAPDARIPRLNRKPLEEIAVWT